MARVPRYDENAPRFSGLPGSAQMPGQLDFSAGGVLGQIANRRLQEQEQAAQTRAQERGVITQTEEGGVGELVSAPDNWAERYQTQFQSRARLVNQNQTALDAERMRYKLAREHERDPDGFSRAWDAYMQGVVGSIEKDDPAQAVELQMTLDETGMQELQRRQEAKVAFEENQQLADFNATLQERNAEVRDYLLETGDEEILQTELRALEGTLGAAVDEGMIDATQAQEALQQERVRYTEEFVRGTFGQSLRANDVGGARGVIGALRRGKWYDDNRQARQLADQLERELDAQLQGQGGMPSDVALELLKRHVMATRGGDVSDEERVMELFNTVMMNDPLPQQHLRGLSLVRAFEIWRVLAGDLDQSSLGWLDAAEAQVRGNVEGLTTDHRNSMLGRIEQERERVFDAMDEGDITSLGGQVQLNDPRYNDRELWVSDLEQRRARVAERLGLPTEATPMYTRDELQQVRRTFEQAVENRDFESLTALMEQILAPATSRWERGSLANLIEQDSAAVGTAAMLYAGGMEADARDVLRFDMQGRDVSPDDLTNIDSARLQRLLEGSELDELGRALAMGDEGRLPESRQLVRNTMLGVAADVNLRGGDWREVRDEVNRLFAPLNDTTEFNNGYRMPTALLDDHPRGARVAKDAINSVLSDSEALGLGPGETQLARFIAPVPLGDDSIGFIDTRTGFPMMSQREGEQDQLLLVFPPQEIEQQFPEGIPENWAIEKVQEADEATRRVVSRSQAGHIASRIDRGATLFGSDKRFTESLALVAAGTKPGSTDLRITKYGLPPDIEDRVDMDRVRDEMRAAARNERDLRVSAIGSQELADAADASDMLSADTAPFVFAAYSRQLTEKYPSNELAAAAFWAGEDVVDEAISIAGSEGALDQLDAETIKFVQRFSDRLGEGPQQQGRIRGAFGPTFEELLVNQPAREFIESTLLPVMSIHRRFRSTEQQVRDALQEESELAPDEMQDAPADATRGEVIDSLEQLEDGAAAPGVNDDFTAALDRAIEEGVSEDDAMRAARTQAQQREVRRRFRERG